MNRVVLITGASSGLGLSLARRFLALDDIVIGVTKTKKRWRQARVELQGLKHMTWAAFDLKNEKKVKQFIRNLVRQFKKIDIVINSAGYGSGLQEIQNLRLREFETNIEQNLTTSFLVCKHTIPVMRKQKSGLIINVASMAGKRAVPRVFAYSAAKFGVIALSQCVAKENADYNIKCLTVCPGGMNTPMRVKFFGKEDAEKQQSADFVADVTMKVVSGEIPVDSGGDIVVRHSKISAINPCPAA